jgi:RNA methyltransferase, TrmH family
MSSPRITSRHNPRVKDATKLRGRRDRQQQGRFLIDGHREISRAVAAGIRILEAFVCDELCTSAECRLAIELLQATDAELMSVAPAVYAKLCFGDREDGVIAVAELPQRKLEHLQLPPEPIVAVLEGIEKPGNIGAVLRSADAAGIDAVIVADAAGDLYNANTIRASLGTVFRDNIAVATAAETLEWLQQQNLSIIAARPDAQKLYTEVDLKCRTAMVLGSEAAGLTPAWNGPNVVPVRLPMHGLADSLNVSTTAAILFYEAVRQRAAE